MCVCVCVFCSYVHERVWKDSFMNRKFYEQHVFGNIINAFIFTFDQFNTVAEKYKFS